MKITMLKPLTLLLSLLAALLLLSSCGDNTVTPPAEDGTSDVTSGTIQTETFTGTCSYSVDLDGNCTLLLLSTEYLEREYLGIDSVLRLPSEIDGQPITAIGDDFWKNTVQNYNDTYSTEPFHLSVEIIIPEGVTKLGKSAFRYEDLPPKEVIWPSTLNELDVDALPGEYLFLSSSIEILNAEEWTAVVFKIPKFDIEDKIPVHYKEIDGGYKTAFLSDGSKLSYTATAAEGYRFSHWVLDGEESRVVSTADPTLITRDDGILVLTPVFERLAQTGLKSKEGIYYSLSSDLELELDKLSPELLQEGDFVKGDTLYIPETVDGYTVNEIAKNFWVNTVELYKTTYGSGPSHIKTVIIPDAVGFHSVWIFDDNMNVDYKSGAKLIPGIHYKREAESSSAYLVKLPPKLLTPKYLENGDTLVLPVTTPNFTISEIHVDFWKNTVADYVATYGSEPTHIKKIVVPKGITVPDGAFDGFDGEIVYEE